MQRRGPHSVLSAERLMAASTAGAGAGSSAKPPRVSGALPPVKLSHKKHLVTKPNKLPPLSAAAPVILPALGVVRIEGAEENKAPAKTATVPPVAIGAGVAHADDPNIPAAAPVILPVVRVVRATEGPEENKAPKTAAVPPVGAGAGVAHADDPHNTAAKIPKKKKKKKLKPSATYGVPGEISPRGGSSVSKRVGLGVRVKLFAKKFSTKLTNVVEADMETDIEVEVEIGSSPRKP